MSVPILFLGGVGLSLFLLLTSVEGEYEMQGRERLDAVVIEASFVIKGGSLEDKVLESRVDSLRDFDALLDALDVVGQLRVDNTVLTSQTSYKDLHALFMS